MSFANPPQLGNIFRNLLDGLHLLSKEVTLYEICHLCIITLLSNTMQAKKLFISKLFQRQGELHGI
eukprot:Gb_13437 [translate_table: standard]